MNRVPFAFPMAMCLASGALAAESPWNRMALSPQEGVVSSVAAGDFRIAVGLSSGAVRLVDPSLKISKPVGDAVFGSRGQVWSLAWHRGDLWIAAGRGVFRYSPVDSSLDRAQKDVPMAMRTGITVLREQNGALWSASSNGLGRLGDPTRAEFQEWKLPVSDEPTAILEVPGRVLVGTTTKGLLLLDSASGEWSQFGPEQGLSSPQVTGLEWSGDNVFVATPEGLDAMDLSTRQIRLVVKNLMAVWMTQVNGALFVSSIDGLYRIDATTLQTTPVALPPGAQAEGNLGQGLGVLVVGGRSEILAREQPTFLGREALRLDPEGYRIALPGPLAAGVRIQAFLRIPEWPEARIPLEVASPRSGGEWLLRIPPDIRGAIQLDLVASMDSRVLETRSFVGLGDRTRPELDLETVRGVVRDSEVVVSGSASGLGPLRLFQILPTRRELSLPAQGEFRQTLRLREGANRFSWLLEDAIGNRVSREVSIRRDDKPPVVGAIPRDTVDGDFARIRIPFRDESGVTVAIQPEDKVRVSMFDSFAVVEANRLSSGDNSWRIAFEDQAGNVTAAEFHVFRRGGRAASLLDSLGKAAEKQAAATPPKPSARGGTVASSSPCGPSAPGSLHVVRYYMRDGETIRKVSQKFYGTRDLDTVLIRWNGFLDSTKWRRMPIGTRVEVPFWTDIDQDDPDVRSALRSFPWDRIPPSRRHRR
jgi:hypothetical protein